MTDPDNLTNIITDPSYYDYLRTLYQQYGSKSSQQVAYDLQNVLGNSSIKRACCLGLGDNDNIEVKIKIPVPEPEALSDPSSIRAGMYKKYNYFVKQIKVPSSLCNQNILGGEGKWEPGSENCNLFYDVFCRNMLDRFNNANSQTKTSYDSNIFNMYQSDCGCYGYVDPRLKPQSVPNKCYMKGCDLGMASRKILYLDPASREGSSCVLNVCNQILDASKNIVGGNYNINAMFKCDISSTGGTNMVNPTVVSQTPTQSSVAQNLAQNPQPGSTSTSFPYSSSYSNQNQKANQNANPQCPNMDTNNLLPNILSKFTSPNIQNDFTSFKNDVSNIGISCAINNNIASLISTSALISISIIIVISLLSLLFAVK